MAAMLAARARRLYDAPPVNDSGVCLVCSMARRGSTARRLAPCLAVFAATAAVVAQKGQPEPIRMVPFHRVVMRDSVWQPRVRLLRERTLPHAFANTAPARRRLQLCAEWRESGGKTELPEPHRYNASDLYKVLEAGALLVWSQRTPEIEAKMDEAIDWIARAQQDDGYLYVAHITGSIDAATMGPRPYSYVQHSHELYNVGHLYEAAVAYAQATGKTRLLEVAEKNAAHVDRVFFQGDPAYNDGEPVMQAPGHQEIELGLVKLYLHTGERRYLDMARRFLAIRGVTFVPDGDGVNAPTYAQQHLPVADQREAVGHAVRATYMYAAMAEVDSLAGTDTYGASLDAIWHDIVDGKMHLSGGLGAVHGIEGFGKAYELPNRDAYLETCAAVGNVFFNLRLFLKHGDARYVDVAEVALYDNCLAGLGLDGTSFFYPNPLEAEAEHRPRSAWFGTACCPSNLARLVPQIAGYMYAQRGNRLYAVLYGANETVVTIGGERVHVAQRTGYPFDGTVALAIDPATPASFELALRIPTWAGTQPVPGALYHYTAPSPPWSVAVNGERVAAAPQRGYVVLAREWRAGDVVELALPMPVHATVCRDEVEADRGRIALTRGPLLLCAESVDNGGAVQRFFVDADAAAAAAKTEPIADGVLAGLVRVTVPAHELRADGGVAVRDLVLIPYFAWSNRDRGSMVTWLPRDRSLATPDPDDPARLPFARVTASHTFDGDTVLALQRRQAPASSADASIRRWTSWPQRGAVQWIEIELKQPAKIASVGVYWYDDGGGVQVPAAPGGWHLEVPANDGAWQRLSIAAGDEYGTRADTFNTVHPATPLTAGRLRIVMQPQHDGTCVGILSVRVEVDE